MRDDNDDDDDADDAATVNMQGSQGSSTFNRDHQRRPCRVLCGLADMSNIMVTTAVRLPAPLNCSYKYSFLLTSCQDPFIVSTKEKTVLYKCFSFWLMSSCQMRLFILFLLLARYFFFLQIKK